MSDAKATKSNRTKAKLRAILQYNDRSKKEEEKKTEQKKTEPKNKEKMLKHF